MATLHVLKGPMKGHSFDLKGDNIFVGRSSDNDIQIKDESVSTRQLKIFRIGEMLFIEDLKSSYGTFVKDVRIEPGEGFEVGEGDTISIGNTVMRFGRMPSPKAMGIPFSEEEQSEKGTLTKERRSRRLHNLRLICRVSELLRQTLSTDGMLEELLVYLLDTLPRIDRTVILQFDNQKMKITGVTARSRQGQPGKSSRYSRPIMTRVLRNGESVKMSNTASEITADFSRDMDSIDIKSVLCVPMIIKSRTCGAIYLDSLRGHYGFRDEDLMLLESLSGPVAVAIENARLTSRLKELEAN
jgi:pSer/pThr/pTyr-binding forkhead associated (FHA) protein